MALMYLSSLDWMECFSSRAQVKEFLETPYALAYPKSSLARVVGVVSTAVDMMKCGESSLEFLCDLDVN